MKKSHSNVMLWVVEIHKIVKAYDIQIRSLALKDPVGFYKTDEWIALLNARQFEMDLLWDKYRNSTRK